MSRIYKIKCAKEKWKGKSIKYSKRVRYQKKELQRVKKERDQLKKEVKEAKAELAKELQKSKENTCQKVEKIYHALQLFLVARISFRAVQRVLTIFADILGLDKVPCTQTIINWVNRLSIVKMQNVNQFHRLQTGNQFNNGLIFLIDISIGLGSGKILTVLALNYRYHVLHEGAPTLKQVHCVGVSVAESWTGELIAEFLHKIIAVIGKPAAYLKDGGKDLAKGVRLLGKQSSPSIDDISHKIAILLKHEYGNHPMLATFTSACGKVSTKLKQSILACLAPPKVSTSSRFMNLHRLIIWASQLLKHSPQGRAKKDSGIFKLRASLDKLPLCKSFIERFHRDASILLKCQELLKTKGLSKKTYDKTQELIIKIPTRSSVRKGFTAYLDEQLVVAEKIGLKDEALPISSDIIESLYGVAKQHGTGVIQDANKIAIRIPTLCGDFTKEDALKVSKISIKKEREIFGSPSSLSKQRRKILPNPGSLDKIIFDTNKQNIELIPGSKNRSKNVVCLNIPDGYKKGKGPQKRSIKQATISSDVNVVKAKAG